MSSKLKLTGTGGGDTIIQGNDSITTDQTFNFPDNGGTLAIASNNTAGVPVPGYQQGTWEMTWTGNGAVISSSANFVRIGNCVQCWASIQFPTTSNTDAQILGNLPYNHNGNKCYGLSLRVNSTTLNHGVVFEQTGTGSNITVARLDQQNQALNRQQCSGVFAAIYLTYTTNNTTWTPDGTGVTIS